MPRQIEEQNWHHMTEDIISGMHEWHRQNPHATLKEIEIEVDARLNRMRARMIEDLALVRAKAEGKESHVLEHPMCPQCGTRLQRRGTQTRHLQTTGGQDLVLKRQYGVCPTGQVGFFPPGRGTGSDAREPDTVAAGTSGTPEHLDALCPGDEGTGLVDGD